MPTAVPDQVRDDDENDSQQSFFIET